jgi:PAS domain S-box-containing protein
MVTVVDVLGVALVGSIIPASVMVYAGWQNRTKPAAIPFAVMAVGIAGWSSAYGASLVFDDPARTVAAANVEYFFTGTVTIGWFLIAMEYVRRQQVDRRWYALFAFPIVSSVVVWTAPDLVRVSARVDAIGVLHPVFGPWFYVQAAINYALTIAGLALFVRDYRGSQGIRRSQTGVLVVGGFVPFVANWIYLADLSPYPELDITPIGFLITSAVFTYGLYRYRLLELVPIARKTVMEEMRDAVVTLDEDRRVADINPRAARLLGVSESRAVGMHGRELFGEYPELVDRFEDTMDVETEISIAENGEQRYFHLDITPVGRGSDVVDGRLIVLRDITELKEREQELDLLKQVLSRVLRHNIRNDVTVVSGYAEELAAETSGETAGMAQQILQKSDDIASRSRKAATIERVLTGEDTLVTLDLETVLQEGVASVRADYPEADISLDLPENCRVTAHEALEVALSNVMENAVVHNEGCPSVTVSADCGAASATITISDDGPGIPEAELSPLEQGEETQLSHSSGIGLWLVSLIVERSGGDVSFESSENGTEVCITLRRA